MGGTLRLPASRCHLNSGPALASFVEPFNYAAGGLFGESPDGGAHAWTGNGNPEPQVLSPGSVAFNFGAILDNVPPMSTGPFEFSVTFDPVAESTESTVVGFLGSDNAIGIQANFGDGSIPGQIHYTCGVPGAAPEFTIAAAFPSVITMSVRYDGVGGWSFRVDGVEQASAVTAPWTGWSGPERPALQFDALLNLVTPILHQMRVDYTP